MTKGAARRQLFGVEGLWCGGCATGLEKRLLSLPGVRRAAVHFLTRSVFLEWDIALVAETDLEASVRQAGYRLAPPRDVPGMRQALEEARTRLVMRLCFALFFGMWSMLPALVLYIDAARIELASLAREFLRAEGLAHVQGRGDGRFSFALFMSDPARPGLLTPEVAIDGEELDRARALAQSLRAVIGAKVGRDVALAAAAELVAALAEEADLEPSPALAVGGAR